MKNFVLITCNLVFIYLIAFGCTALASDTTFYRTEATLVKFSPAEVRYGSATILEDNRLINYYGDYRIVKKHRITYIKTQEGLSDNNKVVAYVPPQGRIVQIKARSISPTGEVVELNQDNIKEMEGYEGRGNLKLFAIEGAQVGGQIEYTYSVRSPMYDSGKELLSMDYRTNHACILLRFDNRLEFDSRSFNWTTHKTKKNTEHKYIYKDILPIAKEEYATPRANRVSVEYKLIKSTYYTAPFYNYSTVLKKFNQDFFVFTTKEQNKIKAALKGYIGKRDGSEEAIRALAVFLKKKFQYKEDYSKSAYSEMLLVLKSGIGNDQGLIKLYCAALTHLGVKYQVHVTANKYDNRLDQEYCSRSSLNEFVIYFPQYDTYLYPASPLAHYGIAPSWVVGNTALVVKKNASIPNFKEVSSRPPAENKTHVAMQVAMDLAANNATFNLKVTGTGQQARIYNRAIYYADTEDKIKKNLEGYVTWRYPNGEILDISRIDAEKWGDIGACEDYACARAYTAKVKSNSFYEKAGNNLLLQVGSLIGPQTEMYSEIDRVQPLTTAHNKSYAYEIRIKIPEGYSYEGAKNVALNYECLDDENERIAAFTSSVKVEDNTVIIDIYEFYARVNVDKKYYEDYRQVVNSAADFNKGVVLLKKS